jgi:nitroreductase
MSSSHTSTSLPSPQDISWLAERRSVAVRRIGGPGPAPDQLQTILATALTAPDHGALRPWRIVICTADGRDRLAALFVAAKLRLKPDATEVELGRERDKALRPPVLLAMLALPQPPRGEVTVAEQLACAGAAMQSVLLAAHGLGFGAIILSGSRCADPAIRAAFALGEADHLLGFISIGTIVDTPLRSQRPTLDDMIGYFDAAGLHAPTD